MEFQTSIPGQIKQELVADFPTAVDRTLNNPTITPPALVPHTNKADVDEIMFDQFITSDLLAEIAGRGTWLFSADYVNAWQPSPASFVADTVTGLQHIKTLIEATAGTLTKWYIECGLVTNSSWRQITPSDIDTLIADFQAIYGDVNKVSAYPPVEPGPN